MILAAVDENYRYSFCDLCDFLLPMCTDLLDLSVIVASKHLFI